MSCWGDGWAWIIGECLKKLTHKYLSIIDILCLYPLFNLLDTLGLFHKWLGQLTNIQYAGEVFIQLAAEFYWRHCVASGDLHIIEGEILCLYFYLHRCVCINAGVFVCFFLFSVVNLVWLLATFTHNRGGDIVYTWTTLHSTSPLWQTKDKNWFLSLKTCFHPSIYINFLF